MSTYPCYIPPQTLAWRTFDALTSSLGIFYETLMHPTTCSGSPHNALHSPSIPRKSFAYQFQPHADVRPNVIFSCGQLHSCALSVKNGFSMREKTACLRVASGVLQREESDGNWREGTKAADGARTAKARQLGESAREREGLLESEWERSWHWLPRTMMPLTPPFTLTYDNTIITSIQRSVWESDELLPDIAYCFLH